MARRPLKPKGVYLRGLRSILDVPGVNQSDVARTADIAYSTLWRLKHLKTRAGSGVLDCLAVALKTTPDALKGYDHAASGS